MIRWIPILALLVAGALHAAPQDASVDDLDALLKDKGLMSRLSTRLEQTRDTVSHRASSIVMDAMGFLGVPYKYGGNSVETGFDCSGFVRAVYEQSLGRILPRRADEQAAATEVIDSHDLKPGDLVFFNTMRRAFSHVGIYVGEGKFIHSPRAGSEVRLEDMRLAYWQTRFNGARRVAGASDTEAGAIPR